MIDLHILTMPGREALAQRAIASALPHPEINVILVPGEPGASLGELRAKAYAHGSNEFVACLDDDDYLLTGLADLEAALIEHPRYVAAYRSDVLLHENGVPFKRSLAVTEYPWKPAFNTVFPTPHHINVMRRSAVEPCLPALAKWRAFDLSALHALIGVRGPMLNVRGPAAYAWTRYEGNTHVKRMTPELVSASLAFRADKAREAILAGHRQTDWQPCTGIKVAGIGVPRTGSRSLALALNMMGYSCAHQNEQLAHGLQLDALVPHYDALADIPLAAEYKVLADRWPDCKFVLTTRPTAPWLPSARKHFSGEPNDPRLEAVREQFFGQRRYNERVFAAKKERYEDEVRKLFAGSDRLLELDVLADNKFEALSAFLGQPPPSTPYPRVKER